MPLSNKRSNRGRRDPRKDKDADGQASPDVDESSPSRPTKRRKRARSPDPARSGSHELDDPPVLDDHQIVTQVTQQLKTQAVQAAKDHTNAIHDSNPDGVKAYAKVAAQDWTFYITKLSVNIGRAPEVTHPEEEGNDSQGHIHIDLGPSKMVSREHASISFVPKDEKWLLQIKGRNGAKVDGQVLKSQTSHTLTSGQVIEIGNVEMIFVLPSEIHPLHVHPMFLKRCGLNTDALQPVAPRRQPLIAPAPPPSKRPGTPPSTQRRTGASKTKSPVAASTPAVMVGANGVDLSHDDNQHIKPQYSYAQMITQAIINAPEEKLNLNGIYTFIMNSYSYYRHQQAAGWQNSIRHNLSLNKSFDKVARSTDEPGKGMKWQIVPEAREDMIRNAYKLGRGGHRGSSAPSSPSQLNYITHGPRDMASREFPSARKRLSPVLSPSRLPPQPAQSTPERANERRGERTASLTADGSPLPRPRKDNAAGSNPESLAAFNPQSPTLTSSYLQEDGSSFVTPAPPRIHPKLAPPSTAQRPSQHMPTSSPAPFWKYAEIGSTPLRASVQYEMSPSKLAGSIRSHSSSPPRASKSPPSSPTRPQKAGASQERVAAEEPDDDQGFDLTKGFQSIGSYHAPVERGVCVANALKGN
ncbi:hypothetical protein HIM_04458 [Hirsutella minnesotensis 3608]|uniref:Fork-head transcriptional regulator 2 n=1 Tax=Hirsutella minnesotensis 3608 TaxID=1043627 RepID=A0A0F8A190_9HYPO|nr:hypothetical protein HIM_04458 [Hirsutella minnesotensis 3608]